MVSVVVGESVVSCSDAARVNAAPTVAVIPELSIIVGVLVAGVLGAGVLVAGTTVDISITGAGEADGNASGEDVTIETAGTFKVNVGIKSGGGI